MKKAIDYAKRRKIVERYYNLSFRRKKNLTGKQKSEISKKYNRLLFFYRFNKKHTDNHFKYVHLKDGERVLGQKVLTLKKGKKEQKISLLTKKGAWVQVPRNATKIRIKKDGGLSYKYKQEKGFKSKGARFVKKSSSIVYRRDVIVKINTLKLLENPEKYINEIIKKKGFKNVKAVHFMINGFEGQEDFTVESMSMYISEPLIHTKRFAELIEQEEVVRKVITHLKFVLVEKRKRILKKK